MATATRFDRDDLMIINIGEPSDFDENSYGDTWANHICAGAPDYNAPDFDGTTSGNRKGINVLIRREDLAIRERILPPYSPSWAIWR